MGMLDGAKYILYADLKSNRAFETGLAVPPAGTAFAVSAIPDEIPAGAGLLVQTKIYADQTNDELFDLTSATAKMYGLPQGSPAARTQLSAGDYAGLTPANGECLFTVPKATIPENWAAYDSVRIWWEFETTSGLLAFWQDVEIIARTQSDPDEDFPESREVPISYVDVATNTTLTAYPGLQIIRIDTTSGNVTVTLFASGATNAGTVLVVQVAGTNDAMIAQNAADTAGINGLTSSITLGGIGRGMLLAPRADGLGFDLISGGLAVA